MALKFNFKVTHMLNTTNDHDRRKNQILKDSPKVLFLVSVAQMLFSLHQFHTCGKFLTFSSHWNLLPRATCYISSHSLMWGKGFLTFPQPIFNFLTFWTCGIGCNEFPHTFPHTRPSRKIKRKIPYIFPMCGTLFSLHQFHTCGKFLTFSSLFPHIFLTLKFLERIKLWEYSALHPKRSLHSTLPSLRIRKLLNRPYFPRPKKKYRRLFSEPIYWRDWWRNVSPSQGLLQSSSETEEAPERTKRFSTNPSPSLSDVLK